MRVALTTYQDLVSHLLDWMGGNPAAEASRDARRAAMNGLRDFATAHQWLYYYALGRLATVAAYSTGTVVYDHTGGTYERMLTLTTGTWPDWAAQGRVTIGNVGYVVDSRKSNSVITLSIESNPGADVASTTYTIFRDTFSLPADFQAMGSIQIIGLMVLLGYEHPSTWLDRQRVYRGVNLPRTYTIMGSPDYMNTMSLCFYPPPDAAYDIAFIYKRRPRDIRIDSYKDGTVSTSGVTVTGSGTTFASKHAGTIIRFSEDAVHTPTPLWGQYPPTMERVILSVESSTSLTVDESMDTLSSVKYEISDPVDVESGAMLTALLRCCELQTAHSRRSKDRPLQETSYRDALILAREADSRSFKDQFAGERSWWPSRMRDFPLGADR